MDKSNIRAVARRWLRNRISSRPALYLPLARLRHGDMVINPRTELVIEGFPRSGNSFAEAALRWSQPGSVRLAHHCHAAAQVIAAASLSVPCLVLIRAPEDAVTSLLMHHPSDFTVRSALSEYRLFHRAIRPARASYVLAGFRAVTQDFGKILGALNRKFGTEFARFETTPETTRQIFDLVDKTSRQRGTIRGEHEPYSLSRSENEIAAREREKIRVRDMVLAEGRDMLHSSREIYESLLATADLR